MLYEVAFEQQATTAWALVADYPVRAWIVDVEGEPVAIFAEAPLESFDDWVAESEAALTELEWTTS